MGRLSIQFKREHLNPKIKRSGTFLVKQKPELESCFAISLEMATQTGQELTLKTTNLNNEPYRKKKNVQKTPSWHAMIAP